MKFLLGVRKPFSRVLRRLQRSADWQVLSVLIAIAIGSTIFSGLQNSEQFSGQWWSDFSQNFSTEMFGAFLTFILLEKIVGSRNTEDRLIREIRSSDNVTALNALAELSDKGWLKDGTLRWANLKGANLKKAELGGAYLQGVNFWAADLREAYLQAADLRGANFWGANLHGADLRGAKLSEGTTLPDGTLWTPDIKFIDLSMYTESNWQPGDPYARKVWAFMGWLPDETKDTFSEVPASVSTGDLLTRVLQELRLLREGQKVNGRVSVRGRRR